MAVIKYKSGLKLQKKAKVIYVCLLINTFMQICCGSAIPIWELLTRNEKLSRSYSNFAQLVSVHCKATVGQPNQPNLPVNQCKHNLLTYGNEKLQSFTNEQLDLLDPYQRNANEIIWAAIMHEHPSSRLVTTRKPLPIPPASSIIILAHDDDDGISYNPTETEAFATALEYAHNPIFNTKPAQKHQYAMDMDVEYGYNKPATTTTYLTGPLVFRVRPDGTPVEEDQHRTVIRDEDLEHFAPSTDLPNNNNNHANTNKSKNKHRKIATISALKQQHLTALALQQSLQPPFNSPRLRRQYQAPHINTAAMFADYYGQSHA